MNHAPGRRRRRSLITWLMLAALAGCADYKAENPALAAYPGIKDQIQQFYDNSATEDDWACDEVELDTIDKSRVISQNTSQVKIAVTYYFTSFDQMPSAAATNARASTRASSPSTRVPAASSAWFP